MRRERGFSLLEVTISLLLLTIGIIGFLHLMGIGLQSSKQAGHITEASFFCQKKMAEFEADRNLLVVTESPISGNFTGTPFSYRYEIKSNLSGLPSSLYFIKVEVLDLDDDTNIVTALSTYLYKPS